MNPHDVSLRASQPVLSQLPQFHADDCARLDLVMADHPGRIVVLEWQGQKVLVKRPELRQARQWRYGALNLLARSLRQPWMQAVPAPGGLEGQMVEAKRLWQLRQAGVAVPELLHVGRVGLVMRYVSAIPLEEQLKQGASADPNGVWQVWQDGLNALVQVHARQQVLSQAFARNILVKPDGGLVFIDFEDDPCSVLPLPVAQARDYLLYLHSSAFRLPQSSRDIAAGWQAALAAIPQQRRSALLQAAARCTWLRHLPQQRKPWGRDTVALQAMGQVLWQWLRA